MEKFLLYHASLMVSGKLPPPRLGLGFSLGLALELGLGGNFPRGQLS